MLVCWQVSRDPHVDRAIITSNSEAILSETWANRYPPRTWMWTRSWVPSRSSDHPSPGPQCRLFLRSCYETRICTAADSRQAKVQRGENWQHRQECLKPVPSSLLTKILVKAPMMPQRSAVTNLFNVRFFIFSRDSDLTTTNVCPFVRGQIVKSSLNQ